MKHVPRLAAEPQSFSTYVDENPADVRASAQEAGAVWERFRSDPAYVAMRDALVASQMGLCMYCEQRLTTEAGRLIGNDQQVEHVSPKSGGAGRTLDWTNLALCCGGGTYREKDEAYRDPMRHYGKPTDVSCGQCKGDRPLGAGCDPRALPCLPRLVDIGSDGKMSANAEACQAVGVSDTELDRVIHDVLNLNCERLRVARQSTVARVTSEIVWLAGELESRLTLGEAAKQVFRDSLVEGRLAPDEHGHLKAFWTTERQYLEPWADAWLAKNHSRLNCPPTAAAPQGTP